MKRVDWTPQYQKTREVRYLRGTCQLLQNVRGKPTIRVKKKTLCTHLLCKDELFIFIYRLIDVHYGLKEYRNIKFLKNSKK